MGKIVILASSAIVLSSIAAFAGQPDNPGVFGKDRAAYIHQTMNGGAYDTGAPGASEVGKIVSGRAGNNGAINQAYKDAHGGSPNPANDNGAGNNSIY